MRHNRKVNHLGRKSGHRKAMLSNMASSLILNKRIETTEAKAKALKPYVEPLITKSKEDTTHNRRVVFSYLKDNRADTSVSSTPVSAAATLPRWCFSSWWTSTRPPSPPPRRRRRAPAAAVPRRLSKRLLPPPRPRPLPPSNAQRAYEKHFPRKGKCFFCYFCRMKQARWILGLLVLSMLGGCGKQMPDEYRQLDNETKLQRKYVNTFAWNVMDEYYLWRDEIAPALERWENWEEPIQKVADIRYKDAAGKDIDRWTMLTDDFASLIGGVSGHTRTFGMDFQLYYVDNSHQRVCAVVTYTYDASPAAAAGLKRGDTILTVDGLEMTRGNYQEIVRDHLFGGGTVKLGLSDGRSATITAVDMYENPVQTVRILERPDGRKVGYLHYTSFTLDSCEDLIDVFSDFALAGIDDLVLDLRYNGGGYLVTEEVLASMLAPVSAVEAGNVLYQEVYNAKMAAEQQEEPTSFKTSFLFRNQGALQVISTAGANPDLPRLYVLATDASASASESLVCCLRPYMDVILVGEQTSGKYCAGYLLKAKDWYDSAKKSLGESEYERALPYVDNWGIYVMYSRYADCNGVTLSMPDGIAPDYEAEDDPLDGFALGDPEETMLAVALRLIEGRTRSAEAPSGPHLTPVPAGFHPRPSGLLVGRY